jgi:hypothetical protein
MAQKPPLLVVAGSVVGRGVVTFPRIGRGRAELRFGSDVKLTVGTEVPFEWWFPVSEVVVITKMTVAKAGEHRGLGHHIFVQGKNLLHKPVVPKFYQGIPSRTILLDILTEVGEPYKKLELAGTYDQYVRRGALAHDAIRALMADRSEVWRWDAESNELVALPEQFVPGPEPKWFSDVPRQHRLVGEFLPLFFRKTAPTVFERRVDRIVHIIGPENRTEIFFQG